MTRYEIAELLGWPSNPPIESSDLIDRVESIVQQAIQTEREACAAICDRHANVWNDDLEDWGLAYSASAKSCAAKIRERGQE